MDIFIPQGPGDEQTKDYLSDKLGFFLHGLFPVSGGVEIGQNVLITQFLPVSTVSLEDAARGNLVSAGRGRAMWRTLILSSNENPLVTIDVDGNGGFLRATQGEPVYGLFEGLNVADTISRPGKFELSVVEIPSLFIRALRLIPLDPGPSGGGKEEGVFIPINPVFQKNLRRKSWFPSGEFTGEVTGVAEERLKFKTTRHEIGVWNWTLNSLRRLILR